MTYFVKSLLFFPFTTGEQTGENFYSNIFIYVKSKYYAKIQVHPLRHLETPRHPIKSEKPLIWMVEGFFCIQRCLKNPFPRLYSRCILPYLDFLRPSCFSLCTPKTYLHRLFHDGFVQQPPAYPASIQWKGAGIVSQLVLLTVVCRKGTILWIRPLWKKEKSIDIKDAVFYPLEEV